MRNKESIRWGILGTGAIAKKFATALNALAEAKLVAIGSRTQAAADQFGNQFRVPHRHDDYDALVNDPEVDVVYVATPHSAHKENALAALRGGKAVLVEKPFTINAAEARAVIDLARSKRLLVMEGMWTRFLPLYVRLREMIADDAIGDVRMLNAEFGFRAGPSTNPRLRDAALGGGALLDIGVYPISLSSMVFGRPTGIVGAATIGPTGVDEQSAVVLRHGNGQLAVISCTIEANSAMEVKFTGTSGSLRVHAPAWKSTAMTWTRDDRQELLQFPFESNGFQFEAMEVMNCLRAGRTESAIMPLDETLSIMATMDELRRQWGLKYPSER